MLVRGVEGATAGAENGDNADGSPSSGLPEGVNQFAVTKLEECGFHRTRKVKVINSTTASLKSY